MRICKACKQRIEDNQTYCAYCGRDNSDIYQKAGSRIIQEEAHRFNLPHETQHKIVQEMLDEKVKGKQKNKTTSGKSILEAILNELKKD